MEGEQARGQAGQMNQELGSAWSRRRSASASNDQAQESAWVASSQGGDTVAFNRLVLKWEKTIYNLAWRMLQNRDEASDATQEVFLLAYKNIRRFRQDARFSTWIYRIAVNHCVTRARQRPPGIHVSLEGDAPSDSPARELRTPQDQEGELLRKECRSRVHRALSFLPPDQRAVIELKFIQDLTFEDIASILQIPLSTIKSRLYSGLEILKVRLSSEA
jgi:RNA polymerase sigma-70 factor, ECF subfamily